MPTGPFPPPLRAFLDQPNLAVMTTLRPDGQLLSVATWYLLDGERLLINMDKSRKRVDHVRQDPRVALIALSPDDHTTYVSIHGRVVELTDDTDLKDCDRLFRHYTGSDFAARDHSRVNAWIDVDRWHGWGALKTAP